MKAKALPRERLFYYRDAVSIIRNGRFLNHTLKILE
jgi:hypothetical protein